MENKENKKESFTPGPWRIKHGHKLTVIGGDYYDPICFAISGPRVDDEANARLIAAAPKMLTALQMVIETLAPHFFEMGIKKSFSEQVVISAVGTAIHSAIGE